MREQITINYNYDFIDYLKKPSVKSLKIGFSGFTGWSRLLRYILDVVLY